MDVDSSRMPPLIVASVLRDVCNGGVLLRIIAATAYRVWLISMADDTWPYYLPVSEFISELQLDPPRFVLEDNDPFAAHNAFLNQPDATKACHDRRWQIVQPLVLADDQERLLVRSSRRQLISKQASELDCSPQLISKLLKLYWKRGMTYHALAPAFDRCGGKGKPRHGRNDPSAPKLGRPRTISSGRGINITAEHHRSLQFGADYFLRPSKPTLKEAHDHMVRHFYATPVIDQSNRVIKFTVDNEAVPTRRQLRYFIEQATTRTTRIKNRLGQKRWDLEEREITGRGDHGTSGPGDRFQIDATIADVYLVSSFDRRRIVGRPVIYFVIDVWSRLITGVYVGYEGPSWVGAMMALTNMVMPKPIFCKQYGIEISQSDWPSRDIPNRILADRGELMSVPLGKEIVDGLLIQIENAPSGRADLKAIVERRFGIVPSIFKQFTPGYVEQDFGQRGSRDYRLDAKFNL
ncbi:hypothetical protein MXD81_50365, partial [Microbacteriaceae bacterium K1510]|nr:hypothetical protein [Microbacteriaceae bacterium K1510]